MKVSFPLTLERLDIVNRNTDLVNSQMAPIQSDFRDIADVIRGIWWERTCRWGMGETHYRMAEGNGMDQFTFVRRSVSSRQNEGCGEWYHTSVDCNV
jgi:hypothetical protein